MTVGELIEALQKYPVDTKVAGYSTCCGTGYFLDNVEIRTTNLNPDGSSGGGCSGGHAAVRDWEIERDDDGFRWVDCDKDQLIPAIYIR